MSSPDEPKQAGLTEEQKNTKQWNIVLASCKSLTIVTDIALFMAVSLIGISFFVESFSVPIVWINAAVQMHWFGEQGHFFHIFLYSLLTMSVITFISHFISTLMSAVSYTPQIKMRWIWGYVALSVFLTVISFLIFVHTVTAVAEVAH